MKNKNTVHAREAVKIYEGHYKPSLNLVRFTKSILGVLISGNSPVAHTYIPTKRRILR